MRILIVGAGLAGLTLAAALRETRAPVEWCVLEQARSLGEVGAGIQLAPNATRLLDRLQLSPRLERAAIRPEAIETRRWSDGSLLASTPLGEPCTQRYSSPYYVLHRADLHQALADLVPEESLRLDAAAVHVADGASAALVRLADGSALTADLVVGADGIRSVVRSALHGDAPLFSGFTLSRGLIPADRLPALADGRKVTMWIGPGRHLVCYPVSQGRSINLVAVTPRESWEGERWTRPADMADLSVQFAGWAPQVGDIIAALDEATEWALFDRDPVRSWSGRHVTLIGDAAHPIFPFGAQGANQAIEDAFALATALIRYPRDLESALRCYEAVRTPRTMEVFENSRGNAVSFHLPDGEEQRRRDAGLGASHVWRDRDWLFGYDAEQATREWAETDERERV